MIIFPAAAPHYPAGSPRLQVVKPRDAKGGAQPTSLSTLTQPAPVSQRSISAPGRLSSSHTAPPRARPDSALQGTRQHTAAAATRRVPAADRQQSVFGVSCLPRRRALRYPPATAAAPSQLLVSSVAATLAQLASVVARRVAAIGDREQVDACSALSHCVPAIHQSHAIDPLFLQQTSPTSRTRARASPSDRSSGQSRADIDS